MFFVCQLCKDVLMSPGGEIYVRVTGCVCLYTGGGGACVVVGFVVLCVVRCLMLSASQVQADEELPAGLPTPESSTFNWMQQWYPVHRTKDISEGEPTRVWLFEEPYVILRSPGEPSIAVAWRQVVLRVPVMIM